MAPCTGSRSLQRILAILACIVLLAFLPGPALAQAGPPLITNDPGTPGPGVWEVNLAATGTYDRDDGSLDAADVDLNYGIGEHIQLSAHLPWAHQWNQGRWTSGIGDLELGVRLRFLDQERAGVDVAIQPQWVGSVSASSRRKGLSSPHPEFVLPLQVAHRYAHAALGTEVARHFAGGRADNWQAGVFAERDCRPDLQCLAEINAEWDGGAQGIVNLGMRRELAGGTTLLGSFGHGAFGRESPGWLFYFGVQFISGE